MRASTIVFLLIFAGIFGHMRRQHDPEATSPASASTGSEERILHTQELMAQIDSGEKRYEHQVRVLGDLVKSIQRLQDVVINAESDLARSTARSDDPVTIEKRRQNVRRLQRDLETVLAGHQRLVLEQERLEGDRASLHARLQLARAGVWEDNQAESTTAPILDSTPDRPSPLDALTSLTRATD